MKKNNLVIVCAGSTSLHNHWIEGDRNFDLMIVDYKGNKENGE